jgi:hypothetical protein
MTTIDFLFASIGLGTLIVCFAYAYKIYADVQVRRHGSQRHAISLENHDLPNVYASPPLEKQLHLIRHAKFGKSMISTSQSNVPKISYKEEK